MSSGGTDKWILAQKHRTSKTQFAKHKKIKKKEDKHVDTSFLLRRGNKNVLSTDKNAALKNNEFMKFLDKWMYLEDIILSEVTQSQKKTLDMHSLISGY